MFTLQFSQPIRGNLCWRSCGQVRMTFKKRDSYNPAFSLNVVILSKIMFRKNNLWIFPFKFIVSKRTVLIVWSEQPICYKTTHSWNTENLSSSESYILSRVEQSSKHGNDVLWLSITSDETRDIRDWDYDKKCCSKWNKRLYWNVLWFWANYLINRSNQNKTQTRWSQTSIWVFF
jgi:hypothetical protein